MLSSHHNSVVHTIVWLPRKMTSQDKLDSIDALFQQAEAELAGHNPVSSMDLYGTGLDQTELRSTTIKTVHAIHSIEKSLSINNSETKSHQEIKKSASVTQQINTKTEQNARIRKRISELYDLAMKDDQELIDEQLAPGAGDQFFMKEKETEIRAAMAEIAHTVKAIPTVLDQKRPSVEETISPDLKISDFDDIVETATRDIIKNEIGNILEDLLPKRLENRSISSNKKRKKTQTKKTKTKKPRPKTRLKKTQAKKTQAKKTQAKKTQAKKTQAKKTQSQKNSAKKTQTKKTQAKK